MDDRDERAYSRRNLHLRADSLFAIQAKRRMRPMRRTISRERRRFGLRQIPSFFFWMNLWLNLFEGFRRLKWDFSVFKKSLWMSCIFVLLNLILSNTDWRRHRKPLWGIAVTSFAIGFLFSRFPLGFPVTERIGLVNRELTLHARHALAVIVPIDFAAFISFIAAIYYSIRDEWAEKTSRVV